MFFRIITGVQAHFHQRLPEWSMSITKIWWGLQLIGGDDVWSPTGGFANMLSLMSENAWGWLAIWAGAAHMLALIVNGTFGDTVYSRYSPHVRGITAMFGAWLWLMVVLSVSRVHGSGVGIYPLPLGLDVWCALSAWYGAGRSTSKGRAAWTSSKG